MNAQNILSRIIGILLVSCISLAASAQKYYFKHYDMEDGLLQSQVTSSAPHIWYHGLGCLAIFNVPPLKAQLFGQKMNAYLKEIADLFDIFKHLTFHLARHTFATTVTLSNNVPIETVSKMLGHANITTTQHYAKILDLKVSQDMAALKQKYEGV